MSGFFGTDHALNRQVSNDPISSKEDVMTPMSVSRSGLVHSVVALALSFPFTPVCEAEGMEPVDAAIVLAVDISSSIDPEQADRQRHGHVEALRSREVQSAIRRGAIGCIAIAYVEWSSVGQLRTVMPWKRICGRDEALGAAALLSGSGAAGAERRGHGRTSLSYAIEASSLMLDNFPGKAGSKIVDISAYGTNNDGLPVAQARLRVLDKGQVINAIAVSRAEPGITDDLWTYFHDNVIAGPGSFAITPDGPEDYAKALRRKLVLEISRAKPPVPVQPARAFATAERGKTGDSVRYTGSEVSVSPSTSCSPLLNPSGRSPPSASETRNAPSHHDQRRDAEAPDIARKQGVHAHSPQEFRFSALNFQLVQWAMGRIP